MKWSWKLGQVAGIGIYMHWSFLLIIGWIVFIHLRQGDDWPAVLEGVIFVLAIFGCVVLHELGHALTAQRFQIRTRDITLLPIGGVARLERMPEDPFQEFLVAIMGPAVNVVIAIALAIGLAATSQLRYLWDVDLMSSGFFVKLMVVNVVLVVFNLLPAFPMDGGRVLRAILAKATGNYVAATQAAASVGQLFAILLGFAGLMMMHPFLIFIALFVYLGAQEEAHMVQIRSLFRGVPVREAMMTHFRSLLPHETLAVAAEELLAGAQQDFPVVENGRIVGLLDRGTLVRALSEHDRETPVGEVMQPACGSVEDTEMLQATFDRMQQNNCRMMPVTRDGRLIGLVTLENVGELMMIHSALERRRPPRSIEAGAGTG